jgi:hypothetical protein
LQSWYCHLSRVQVPKGAQVRAGDLIGNVGETGNAFGFHLHFEIRKDGTPVDPMPYISGHPAPSSPTYPEPDAGIISAGLDALNPFDDIARNVGHVILLGVVLAGAAVALQPAREKARGVALDALSVIPETAAIANAAKATKGA